MSKISRVLPLPHLDSQGGFTIKVAVELESGARGWGSVPKGATPEKLRTLGITHLEEMEDPSAIAAEQHAANFRQTLTPKLVGLDATDQRLIDDLLSDYNTKDNWAIYGINVMLAASLAVARAAASEHRVELFEYIASLYGTSPIVTLPVPMTTVLEGGPRIANNLVFQAIMLVPVGALTVAEAHQMTDRVFFQLQNVLRSRRPPLSISVGEQGGFVPRFPGGPDPTSGSWRTVTLHALDLVVDAVLACGFRLEEDFCLAMDCAMTGQRYDNVTSTYRFLKSARPPIYAPQPARESVVSTDDLLDFYQGIRRSHAVWVLEDPFHQADRSGWSRVSRQMGSNTQIVGDDLFYDFGGVLSPRNLLRTCADHAIANAMLVMPNRAATLTSCISLIQLAQSLHYTVLMAVRARETEDHAIVDIAAGCAVAQLRCGGLQCTERNSKFDRLRFIEELAGPHTTYAREPLVSLAAPASSRLLDSSPPGDLAPPESPPTES